MRAYDELGAKLRRALQLVVFAQNVIGLIYEDLLHLRVQMGLRLLDEDQMQRGDQIIRSERAVGGLADAHPFIAKTHQRKHDRDQILVSKTVGFLRQSINETTACPLMG